MSLRVIGAGVGRTGTTSLKLALETLGFGSCYHMEELLRRPDDAQSWLNAADGKPVDWDALFRGFQAAVDLPTYVFYEELMAHYPESQVVLTVRDPESWYTSASKTIFRVASPTTAVLLRILSVFSSRFRDMVKVLPVARRVGLHGFFGNDLSKANALRVFEEHNERVRRIVPAERLLVYDVRQGWEPLCEFLGVAQPDEPFPHTNTREEFGSRNQG